MIIELGDPRTRDTLIATTLTTSSDPVEAKFRGRALGPSRARSRHTDLPQHDALTGRLKLLIGAYSSLTGDDLQNRGHSCGQDNAVTCNDGFVDDNLYGGPTARQPSRSSRIRKATPLLRPLNTVTYPPPQPDHDPTDGWTSCYGDPAPGPGAEVRAPHRSLRVLDGAATLAYAGTPRGRLNRTERRSRTELPTVFPASGSPLPVGLVCLAAHISA